MFDLLGRDIKKELVLLKEAIYQKSFQQLNINTIPESKEHKLAKNWIYNKIKQKNLLLTYSIINKPYKYPNQINLFDLPLDYEKIGIEVITSTLREKRRADVICPFIRKHKILGKGIVFEIQFSKQKERTKKLRELDWAIRGYSIAIRPALGYRRINTNLSIPHPLLRQITPLALISFP